MRGKIRLLLFKKRGQAIAEFALVLPLLLIVVIGLIEVGRAIFIYSSVTNASREAVRYASAYGINPDNNFQFQDCDAIRNTARRTGFFLDLADDDIVIEYDTGPYLTGNPDTLPNTGDEVWSDAPAPFDTCDAADGVDEGVVLACGDRVVVTITAYYAPIITLIPMSPRAITSTSARTYFGVIELEDDFIKNCNWF